jgi:hypothetical protein
MAGREWLIWDAATAAARSDVEEAVAAFASIDTPAGEDAARWLRDDALHNDGSTRTRLLMNEGRVAGFFALCAAEVRLRADEVEVLGLPPGRHPLPAILLAWIARHRDGGVTGYELMRMAFGIARRVRTEIGAVAFVLDPRDVAVAGLWRAPPYGFRPSSGGSRRLWLPLSPES